MKYMLVFPFGGKDRRDCAYVLKMEYDAVIHSHFASRDGDRWLTPAETAAYLLGAPASSFPVEAPKDEELPA